MEYLDQHGASEEEFEFVVSNPERVERSRSSKRPIAFGKVNGRSIACVYDLDGDEVVPVTAFEV
ncbi:MAG: hypothetical protein AAF596_11045 [Planctomycetota bacterium]